MYYNTMRQGQVVQSTYFVHDYTDRVPEGDLGFPTRAGANPKVGVQAYYLAKFYPKIAWKWKKLDPEGRGMRPLQAPWIHQCTHSTREGNVFTGACHSVQEEELGQDI